MVPCVLLTSTSCSAERPECLEKCLKGLKEDADQRAPMRKLVGLGTWVTFMLSLGLHLFPLKSTKIAVSCQFLEETSQWTFV